jgi:hypothetical protein
MNPNYNDALTVPFGPDFTQAEHPLANAVQTNMNRAIRGETVNRPQIGDVAINALGDGSLAPAATPYFEDVKAYYSLMAAGMAPPDALKLVEQSSAQLERAGVGPVRIPSR